MSQFDFSYLYHRPIAGGQGEVGISGMSDVDDIDLVKRIHAKYRSYRQQAQAELKDIWNSCIGDVRKEDEAKLPGPDVHAVATLLRDPAANKSAAVWGGLLSTPMLWGCATTQSSTCLSPM
jgi:hypothetical protein